MATNLSRSDGTSSISAELAMYAKNLEEVTHEIAAIVEANCDFRQRYNQAVQHQRIYTKTLIIINDNHESSGQNHSSEDPAADIEYALYHRKKLQEEIDKLLVIFENLNTMFIENNKIRSQAVLGLMGFKLEKEEKEKERLEKELLEKEKEENRKLVDSLLGKYKDVGIGEQLKDFRIESRTSTQATPEGVVLFTRPQRDALVAGLERIQCETEIWIEVLEIRVHKPIKNIAIISKAMLMKDRDAVEVAEGRDKNQQLTDSQIRLSIFRLGEVYKYMEQDQFKLWRIAGKYVEPKDGCHKDPKAFARPKDWKPDQPQHT